MQSQQGVIRTSYFFEYTKYYLALLFLFCKTHLTVMPIIIISIGFNALLGWHSASVLAFQIAIAAAYAYLDVAMIYISKSIKYMPKAQRKYYFTWCSFLALLSIWAATTFIMAGDASKERPTKEIEQLEAKIEDMNNAISGWTTKINGAIQSTSSWNEQKQLDIKLRDSYERQLREINGSYPIPTMVIYQKLGIEEYSGYARFIFAAAVVITSVLISLVYESNKIRAPKVKKPKLNTNPIVTLEDKTLITKEKVINESEDDKYQSALRMIKSKRMRPTKSDVSIKCGVNISTAKNYLERMCKDDVLKRAGRGYSLIEVEV